MGGSQSKKIQDKIQQNYKSIRKFYSDFYGEITLVKKQTSGETYAKIEKIIPNNNKKTKQYLDRRKQKSYHLLIGLHQYYAFKIDLCSEAQNYILIFQYTNHTLYDQICLRQHDEKYFQIPEILLLFSSYVKLMQSCNKIKSKLILTNRDSQYQNPGQLKIIEMFLCNYCEDSNNYLFMDNQSDICDQKIYFSPEIKQMIERKEYFQAKQSIKAESSLVFTLGMNFLEILTLANLSSLYSNSGFSASSLNQINQQARKLYGDQITKLTIKMTDVNAAKRPTIQDIDEYIEILMKNPHINSKQFHINDQFSYYNTML